MQKLKKLRLWLFNRFIEALFYFFLGLSKIFSFPNFRHLTAPIIKLVVKVIVPQKRIARNLQGAFGKSYSPSTKKGLAKGVQEHFVKNLKDCLSQLVLKRPADKIASVEGIENLKRALAKGKGVIALGAHIGNFAMVGTRLGLDGYSAHILFRLPKDTRSRRIIERYLPRFHQKVIPSFPRREAVKRILQALKKNEIVFILGDNLKRGKIRTRLFGQIVPSPRGPASLALRSGAPVLPIYLIRGYRGEPQLIIEPEMPIARTGNLPADIVDNTQRITSYLEGLIRRYPDQWIWLTARIQRTDAKIEKQDLFEPTVRIHPSLPYERSSSLLKGE